MTPDELLAAAQALMQRPDTLVNGIWPRAAALLARQALEAAMAELWASQPQAAEMSSRSMRSQLLCLTAYLDPARPAEPPTSSPPSATPATTTPTNWPPPQPNSPAGSTRPPRS